MSVTNEDNPVVDHAKDMGDKHDQQDKATSWYPMIRGVALCLAIASLIGFVVLGILIRQHNLVGDYGLANIVFLICPFLGVLLIVGWLSVFAFRGWQRLLPPVVLFLLMASPFLFLKIREVDGEMVPIFAWRFAPDPDELLEVPPPVETTADDPEVLSDLATVTPEDFDRFLGTDGRQRVASLFLEHDWDAHPPKLLWEQPIGAGWSAFATRNGYAVTMEQRSEMELVTCYEVETGKLIWSHGVPTRYETKLGGIGPRATPTIDEHGMVFANGATGILRCINGNTGQLVWKTNILEELSIPVSHDASSVMYGRSNSPLVYDDVVVVPGGRGPDGPSSPEYRSSLVAFDRDTGELKWQGGSDQIAYASPVLGELDGVRQVISVNESSVTGHDADSGNVLWSFECGRPGSSSADSNNSQPVVVGEDLLFISKSYGIGSALKKIRRDDAGDWQVTEIWQDYSILKTKFTNVVIHDGYAYGLSDGIMQCADLNTGEEMWKGGRFHQGQILGVGDVILLVNEKKAEVTMIDMNPDGFYKLGKFQALSSTEKVWNHLALYGNKLLVRDAQTAACWELPIRKD